MPAHRQGLSLRRRGNVGSAQNQMASPTLVVTHQDRVGLGLERHGLGEVGE